MSSSIPTARSALVAMLEALTGAGEGLEGVHVARTGVWKEQPQDDYVEVLNAREIERERRLGGLQVAETYDLPVRVRCYDRGADLEAVELRLWERVTAVEGAVLADNRLGGAVSYCNPAQMPDGERSGPADGNTVFAEITMHFNVGARPSLA